MDVCRHLRHREGTHSHRDPFNAAQPPHDSQVYTVRRQIRGPFGLTYCQLTDPVVDDPPLDPSMTINEVVGDVVGDIADHVHISAR